MHFSFHAYHGTIGELYVTGETLKDGTVFIDEVYNDDDDNVIDKLDKAWLLREYHRKHDKGEVAYYRPAYDAYVDYGR